MQTYKGSCHCGAVEFEIQSEPINKGMECNCSICSKKGTILGFASPENFKLNKGENALSGYQFYKKVVHHTFCKTCGVTPFLKGKNPKGEETYAINLRCLEGVDPHKLEISQVDGRSF